MHGDPSHHNVHLQNMRTRATTTRPRQPEASPAAFERQVPCCPNALIDDSGDFRWRIKAAHSATKACFRTPLNAIYRVPHDKKSQLTTKIWNGLTKVTQVPPEPTRTCTASDETHPIFIWSAPERMDCAVHLASLAELFFNSVARMAPLL